MKFKTDAQRRAVFARMKNQFFGVGIKKMQDGVIGIYHVTTPSERPLIMTDDSVSDGDVQSLIDEVQFETGVVDEKATDQDIEQYLRMELPGKFVETCPVPSYIPENDIKTKRLWHAWLFEQLQKRGDPFLTMEDLFKYNVKFRVMFQK